MSAKLRRDRQTAATCCGSRESDGGRARTTTSGNARDFSFQDRAQLRITFLRRSGGTETNGNYISGDLTYQPVASTDLTNWNITPIPVPNPSGLPLAPEGFEWTSYAIPDFPETENKGFIKLKVDAQ